VNSPGRRNFGSMTLLNRLHSYLLSSKTTEENKIIEGREYYQKVFQEYGLTKYQGGSPEKSDLCNFMTGKEPKGGKDIQGSGR